MSILQADTDKNNEIINQLKEEDEKDDKKKKKGKKSKKEDKSDKKEDKKEKKKKEDKKEDKKENNNNINKIGVDNNNNGNIKEEKIIKSRIDEDFKNLEKIGEGGFGVVLKGIHRLDKGVNAIKIIKLSSISEKERKRNR